MKFSITLSRKIPAELNNRPLVTLSKIWIIFFFLGVFTDSSQTASISLLKHPSLGEMIAYWLPTFPPCSAEGKVFIVL